jgi:hypothetical protein
MANMSVKYVGVTSDFRGLTEKDLQGWGISVDLPDAPLLVRRYVEMNTWTDAEQRPLDPTRDLVWGPHNQHTLVLDVSPELETLLRAQGHFLLTEVKDSGEEGETVAPPTDVTHPGDEQVNRQFGVVEGRSETDRTVDPAALDRPDPAWKYGRESVTFLL